jgi:hypothetical protein
MFQELLRIYRSSLVNEGAPKCLFAETLIFNEGWLLRSVLREWLLGPRSSQFGFLPFPSGVAVYSEGQLYTPFKARFRGDQLAESHTHVDGIAGDFSIDGTKSGIVLRSDLRYIAAFEAKLFSRISSGVKNAPDFDQVSRTAACLINSILLAGPQANHSAHLVVMYAEDNRYIDPSLYTKAYVEKQITKRLQDFLTTGAPGDAVERFARGWKDVLDNLRIHFHTWEQVVAEIGSAELSEFYKLCKRFNRQSSTAPRSRDGPT